MLLGRFVDVVDFAVEYFVIMEVASILEEIDFEVFGRVEVFHFVVYSIGLGWALSRYE